MAYRAPESLKRRTPRPGRVSRDYPLHMADQPIENSPQESDRRSALEAEREVVTSRMHELDSEGDELAYDDNFADSAQVAAEMGENRVLYDQLRRELDDIEKALERMDEGTYGTCEVCGDQIGEARLEAMPSTRRCIEHA